MLLSSPFFRLQQRFFQYIQHLQELVPTTHFCFLLPLPFHEPLLNLHTLLVTLIHPSQSSSNMKHSHHFSLAELAAPPLGLSSTGCKVCLHVCLPGQTVFLGPVTDNRLNGRGQGHEGGTSTSSVLIPPQQQKSVRGGCLVKGKNLCGGTTRKREQGGGQGSKSPAIWLYPIDESLDNSSNNGTNLYARTNECM